MRLLTFASAVTLIHVATYVGATTAVAQNIMDANSIANGLYAPTLVPRGIKHFEAAVSLNVLFAVGSADLTAAGRAQLDQLGVALKDPRGTGRHFRIEGHTDTTGDDQLNMRLSERRATTVVRYLVARYEINRGQLVPVGMGKHGLAVPTPDQTPEPRNRRVVVINLDG